MKKARFVSTGIVSLMVILCSMLVISATVFAGDEIEAPKIAPSPGVNQGTIEVSVYNEFTGNNIDGVQLFQRINGGEWTLCADIPLSDFQKSYYDYKLTPTVSGKYEYKHRVYVGSNQGAYGKTASVQFLKEPKLTSVVGSGNKLTVTWEKDSFASSYNLYVGDKNLTWYTISEYTIPGNKNTHTVTINEERLGETLCLSLQAVNDSAWSESITSNFVLLETPVLRSGLKTSSSAVHLCWNKVKGALSYDIFRYDEREKRYILIKTVGTGVATYTDSNRQASTNYRYKIQARRNESSGKVKPISKSSISKEVSVYTHAKNAGKIKVKLKSKEAFSIKSYTDIISEFFDHKGNYTVVYSYGKYTYIRRLNTKTFKVKKTIKIKNKYPVVGGVTCDKNGNYYIAWGRNNSGENKKKVTFAISKYNYKGKHIKTAKGDAALNVKSPFAAGGCSMAIDGNNLVCNFARRMYKASDGLNHQASQVFAVNTKTMKRVKNKYYNYVSHSFSQRVIALSGGGVLFADHGDGYPRGFTLKDQKYGRTTPFHFYGKLGENYTNATLGDVLEVSSGYILIGTSGKSMKSLNGNEQIFVQLINPYNGKSILNNSKRVGTSCGKKTTDTGVKWLTNYNNDTYIFGLRAAVIDKERILILWGRDGGKKKYNGTYYMILSASGKVLKKATRLSKQYITSDGSLNVKGDCVYWAGMNYNYKNNKVKVYRLKVN